MQSARAQNETFANKKKRAGKLVKISLFFSDAFSVYCEYVYFPKIRRGRVRNSNAKFSKSECNSANYIHHFRPNRDGAVPRNLFRGDKGRAFPYTDPLICYRSLLFSET